MKNMLKKYGIDGIYIIHAKKGYEKHEERIRKLFDEYGFEYEFVTEGDPSLFHSIDLSLYFTSDFLNKMSNPTISCTLNHLMCYEQIASNKNNLVLVFEDDPIFLGDFISKIQKIIKEVKLLEKGFIVSLEGTTQKFPSYWQTKRGKNLYKAKGSRCAGAYLIDITAVKSILNYLENNKCNLPIDWWQNLLIQKNVISMYWAHPPLVEQGSHNGLLSSTISTRQNGLGRRIKWKIQKIYKKYIRRLFSQILINSNN